MPLSEAHARLLDQIENSVRTGQLARQPIKDSGVQATMPRPGVVYLTFNGPSRAVANDWMGACADRLGATRRRPAPHSQTIIEVSVG